MRAPDAIWAVYLCGFAIALLLVAERGQLRWLKWLAKPLASIAFVLTALLRGALATRYGEVIVVSLLLGLMGDVLLIPKSKKSFLLGIGAFLLGHVGFCVAFVVRGLDWKYVPLAALVLGPIGFAVARWLIPSVPAKLKVPVIAYMTVISTMLILAVGAAAGGATILFVAALLFYASDLSVALDRFKSAGFWNRAWGLPAYFIAQLLFAWYV